MFDSSRQEPPPRKTLKSAMARAQSSMSQALIIIEEINVYLLAVAIGLAFFDFCLYVALHLPPASVLSAGLSDQAVPFSAGDLGSAASGVSTQDFCGTQAYCLPLGGQ